MLSNQQRYQFLSLQKTLVEFLRALGKAGYMHKLRGVSIIFFIVFIVTGCSKKSHPAETPTATAAPVKTVKKSIVKTAVPKVITVNDNVAKRSLDGRYYYDLEGHRYWRNNRDGKYYLFNKSMFDNPDFKSRGN